MSSKTTSKPPHVVLIVLTLLTQLITSCEQSEKTLRVGANSWVGYAPLFLAQELDEYKHSSVRILEMPSTSEVIHALNSGNLEVAALTLDEVLTVIEEGIDLQVILVLDISNGADALLAKPKFNDIDSLKDKTIAVEHKAVGGLLLDQALASKGLTSRDIEIIGCTFNNHEDCFNKYDAVVTFEPTKSQILRHGANILFDSSQMTVQIMDVLAAPKSVIESHPKSLKQLVAGYFSARKFMTENKQQAFKIIANQNKLSQNELENAYNGLSLPERDEILSLLTGTPSKLTETADYLANSMLKQRLLKNKVDIQNLANSTFVSQSDD